MTEIENIYNDRVDVIVRLDDDCNYAIDLPTPQYLLSVMKENNQPFIGPGENYIMVEKLTPEIIKKTLTAFVKEENAYWLKLLHISHFFEIETLNNLRNQVNSEYSLTKDDLKKEGLD